MLLCCSYPSGLGYPEVPPSALKIGQTQIPRLCPIRANLLVIARRLIVPEGLMRVARLRKAYVATGAVGIANHGNSLSSAFSGGIIL